MDDLYPYFEKPTYGERSIPPEFLNMMTQPWEVLRGSIQMKTVALVEWVFEPMVICAPRCAKHENDIWSSMRKQKKHMNNRIAVVFTPVQFPKRDWRIATANTDDSLLEHKPYGINLYEPFNHMKMTWPFDRLFVSFRIYLFILLSAFVYHYNGC